MSEPAPPAEVVLPAEIAPPPALSFALLSAARQRYQETLALLTRGQSAHEAALTDVDYIHDLRVASRRLTETARLLGEFLDKPAAQAVEASLKGLRRAVGDLRDLDVTCEHLLKWRMPGPVKAHARALAGELAQKRPVLEEAGRQHMASASVSGAMVVLARVLEEWDHPDKAPAAEEKLQASAAQQARKRRRKLRRAFGRAAQKQTPEALHAARIAVKKLRYVLELMQEFKRGLKRQIRELKRLQELLGDHHDVHVILSALAAHVKKAGEPNAAKRRQLHAAWRRWHGEMEHGQAKRATTFFVTSYAWLNS